MLKALSVFSNNGHLQYLYMLLDEASKVDATIIFITVLCKDPWDLRDREE